ncbi:MAG: MBOAT family protein [Lachnospiraceae bacterium]|nr:MBOAT family protein [Lachnospiraceae bacterium]
MLFNSIDFLIFFPIVVSVYLIIPKKLRTIWLLIASYYFYMSWNAKYALLIAFSTAVTYLSGLALEKSSRAASNPERKKKLCVFVSFFLNLSVLGLFKYADFVLENLNHLSAILHLNITFLPDRLGLLLPVGISFYTFQALSYTMDVYRGRIRAERNFLRYALFVSFFPQLVAGPIERSENLLPQLCRLEELSVWNRENIRDGLLLMVWGLFQKLVIADRISIVVREVYQNYTHYGLAEIALSTLLFAFQIYCDFGGYSDIARGAARVMGINLMHNFRQPYFAVGIRDFWRRWHISLTSWFTDYLYIPLGGSRCGTLKKYLNIFIVFFVSGLWHGASWNFVAWGMLHAFYQIGEDCLSKCIKPRTRSVLSNRPATVGKILLTFLLADFAWLFFASEDMAHVLRLLAQMGGVLYSGNLAELNFTVFDWVVLLSALVVLFIVDLLHERGVSVFSIFNRRSICLRIPCYLALIWGVILLGVYGYQYDVGQFIYFQF